MLTTSGIETVDREMLGIATVLVRKGKRAELIARVRERFGVELPAGPQRAVAASARTDIAFAGIAPGGWLAMCEDGGAEFAASLAEALDGVASVSDQSDGLYVVRVSGANVRDVLCKLVPVDLHPREFAVGQVAVTLAAHMPVTMWRLADSAAGAAVFEIATFRSFAESFRHALSC